MDIKKYDNAKSLLDFVIDTNNKKRRIKKLEIELKKQEDKYESIVKGYLNELLIPFKELKKRYDFLKNISLDWSKNQEEELRKLNDEDMCDIISNYNLKYCIYYFNLTKYDFLFCPKLQKYVIIYPPIGDFEIEINKNVLILKYDVVKKHYISPSYMYIEFEFNYKINIDIDNNSVLNVDFNFSEKGPLKDHRKYDSIFGRNR